MRKSATQVRDTPNQKKKTDKKKNMKARNINAKAAAQQ
jgi:hypothetical protein